MAITVVILHYNSIERGHAAFHGVSSFLFSEGECDTDGCQSRWLYIVRAVAYSQAMYILSGNPGKSARERLRESEQLMQGQKMRFFKLNLSFIGWFLLCIVTLGIASIWVVPYYHATMATFYIDIMPSTSDDTDTYDEPTPTRTNGRTITFGNKSGGSDISKG